MLHRRGLTSKVWSRENWGESKLPASSIFCSRLSFRATRMRKKLFVRTGTIAMLATLSMKLINVQNKCQVGKMSDLTKKEW